MFTPNSSLDEMASIGTLYGIAYASKTQRILAAAKVNGLQLDFVETSVPEGSSKPEFKAKFPLGQIPAFEGSDGFLLTESRSILRYGTY